MKPIPYGRQYIDDLYIKSVKDSLKKEKITTGDYVSRFEKKISSYLDVKYATSCSSGTAALHLAFNTLDLKKNDNIIMPAINFIASYNICSLYKSKIFLADVDPNTGQMTPETLETCIKRNGLKKIKLVITMYLGGYPENIINFYNDLEIDDSNIDFKKMAVNMMIGGFKPNLNKNVKWLSVCIIANSCEAYNQYLQNKGCFIEIIKINEVKFFHVYKEIESTNIETEKPIYDQILDLEAIALHKLATLIESKGGEVLDLNTDCATCIFKNVFPFELDNNNIKGYYYDKENKVPLYKLEDKHTRLQIERMPLYSRNKTYEYEYFKWQVVDDVEDNDFKPLVDTVINSNKSYFITGPAGTGKSQLIRDIKDQLDKNGKSFKCLAPTNLAALNIKGSTIHKFVSKIKKMDSIYKLNHDYIFIDEISMVKEVL
jgi:DNA replication protein DnaC